MRSITNNPHHSQLQLIGRVEATEIGQRLFWPDKECPNGHMTWRYVSNGKCKECMRVYNFSKSEQVSMDGKKIAEQIQESRDLKKELNWLDD